MVQRLIICFSLAIFVFSCQPEVETPPGTTPYDAGKLPDGFGNLEANSPKDNPNTVEGVALGRMLFYEKRLSGNNTMSCGSCHQQKFAFTDGKAVSTGIDGVAGTRSAMSLVNLAWGKNFNWDGGAATLEEQLRTPLESPIEMHQPIGRSVNKLQNTATYPPLFQKAFGSKTITEENIAKALAQFVRTLISVNSKFDRFQKDEIALTPEEEAGFELFDRHPDPYPFKPIRGANCFDCHPKPQFSQKNFANNGLDLEFTDPGLGGITGKLEDMGKFKAPSLRNIALTAPYMHDGRFKTLREVLEHYNKGIKKDSPNLHPEMSFSNTPGTKKQLDLTEDEIDQVLAFLETLTDTSFVNDPRFSDPFEKTGMVP